MSTGSAGNDEVLLDERAGAQELLLVSGQLLNDGSHPAVENSACHIPGDDSEIQEFAWKFITLITANIFITIHISALLITQSVFVYVTFTLQQMKSVPKQQK